MPNQKIIWFVLLSWLDFNHYFSFVHYLFVLFYGLELIFDQTRRRLAPHLPQNIVDPFGIIVASTFAAR